MTAGDSIFMIAIIALAFLYMKVTDYQIEQLDKRISIVEHKLNIVPHRT